MRFTANAKSGVITVINEGTAKMSLQISASEWTQDGKGKDVYTETADIVFYPKIMALEKGEQRVIRAGVKGPQPLREKTYRLFIEEIPERKKADEGKSQVSIVIRFAPPIFVRPLVESRSGSLEKVELAKGKLTVVVKNTGNVHATITAVTVQAKASDGREVFAKDISGWYLLNGVSRPYEAAIPGRLSGGVNGRGHGQGGHLYSQQDGECSQGYVQTIDSSMPWERTGPCGASLYIAPLVRPGARGCNCVPRSRRIRRHPYSQRHRERRAQGRLLRHRKR